MSDQRPFIHADSPEEHGRLFLDSFNAGDLDALDRVYSADAISVWEPGNPLSGQARKDALREFLALKPRMTAALRESFVAGDTALLIVDWSIDIPAPGGAERMSGTGVDVLRRGADGAWRFAVDNPFGGAPPLS
ncbi:YybH family protein [Streptomyces sp. NPDC020141]|uniref:YybH family protein n=1 Tax=Streptomyces sp. NPDC020141 TaxID=3365065 RepID=UPI003794ED64